MTTTLTADWRDAAACAGAETDVFFPHPKSGSDYREALAFCGRCPVADACLTDALLMERNNSDRHGMRGGLTPEQRARLVKHR